MPRIIATIGAPRSGKSTFALKFNPNDWVTCTFDDLRATLFPPHRRVYWDVRKSPAGERAQKLLHSVKDQVIHSALDKGFNVVAPDTHIKEHDAQDLKALASLWGVTIEWKVLSVPLDVLSDRNAKSDTALGHQVPNDILQDRYNLLWADDAWWRKEPNVEIINHDQIDNWKPE